MAMLDYDTYKLLHLAGAFAITMAYGGLGMWAMNEKDTGENRFHKLGMISHGIGQMAIIIGGFGMLANLYDDSPFSQGWVHFKLGIWILLGGGLAVLKKKPEHAKEILAAAFILIFLAGSIGANHFKWFGA
ncbi:MAG: hypothetical protein P8Q90_06760 [Candidatus Thalassarchaeaceae archaeon]|jgi:hypothetical protein|nr:hypothetical protein [Candidatus Thalassarchaeaceae archaeon]